MAEPSVLFCTPCYGGMVTAGYLCSALQLKDELNRIGLDHDWQVGTNESLVTRARNEMTAAFLNSDFSHMMWIDADILFSVEDVIKVWNLCEGDINADIGVGVYAMKKADKQWFAAWKDGALVKDLDQFKEPIEVDYAGTGFMLIKRHVVETLAKSAPSYQGNICRVPALYMTPIHDDGFESEDYHFCRLAREAGFKIMMDASVRLGHIGQYCFGA